MANMTLQDLATRAGVSISTVSRALRNDPRLREETCERIQTLAIEMGYRPDPLISALSERRWQKNARSDVTTIAWVSPSLSPHTKDDWFFSTIFQGASGRADSLGYKLELFRLREPGMTNERFVKILLNRGIRGMCVAPLSIGENGLELDWSHFACACIGYSMRDPVLHRASPHHAQGIREAIRRFYLRGYRRIGVCMNPEENRRTDYQWLAGALLAEAQYNDLFLTTYIGDDDDHEAFAQWLRSNRLDSIIAATNAAYGRLKDISVELPVASLAWVQGSQQPGIDQKFKEVGAAAIDLVIGQLRRNEQGIPNNPRVIMIDGDWREATEHAIGATDSVPVSGSSRKRDR